MRAMVVCLVFAVSGCGGNPLESSPEGKVIDKMLRENIPGGKYTVLEWHGPRQIQSLDEAVVEDATRAVREFIEIRRAMKSAANSVGVESVDRDVDNTEMQYRETLELLTEYLKNAKAHRPMRYCHLKYRCIGESGVMEDRNRIFWVHGGKAYKVYPEKLSDRFLGYFSE